VKSQRFAVGEGRGSLKELEEYIFWNIWVVQNFFFIVGSILTEREKALVSQRTVTDSNSITGSYALWTGRPSREKKPSGLPTPTSKMCLIN
jgi:hypothetical protein